MQTEILPNSDGQVPRLEYYSAAGEAAECSPLRSFPFTIGRVKSVDLQVNSKRVSREHAVILKEQEKFRVRDLGSTNGTFLNGQPIDAGWLTDGDILTIADTEFTFLCGDDRQASGMATQVMSENEEQPTRSVGELIFGIRKMHELLSRRAVDIGLRPIVCLDDDAIFGWSMVTPTGDGEPFSFRAGGIVSESRSHLTSSLRQLARVTSVNEFTKRQLVDHLLVSVNPVELEDPETLASHFSRLNDDLPKSVALVAVLQSGQTFSAGQVGDFRDVLDQSGTQLALESKVANSKQLLEFAEARPAHVILTANVFRDVTRQRAARRQLTAVLAALENIGCEPIADGILDDEDWNVIRDLGFQLAFRNKETREDAGPLTAQIHECRLNDVPTDSAQSTRAEIAKVTARIRASWSNR